MKQIDFDKLMAHDPMEYDRMINIHGQEVVFYEHPTLGDESPVIAAFPKEGIAVVTEFWEQDDMMNPESDYALELDTKSGIVLHRYETY